MSWDKFGKSIKSATGVSLAALVLILASNGKAAIEALMGLPVLITAYSQGLPFGFWSGVLATVIACGFHTFARSWHRRSFAIELATIMVGLTGVMVQQWGGDRGQVLSALLVGLVAGFGGLFTSKALLSLRGNENVKSTETLSDAD